MSKEQGYNVALLMLSALVLVLAWIIYDSSNTTAALEKGWRKYMDMGLPTVSITLVIAAGTIVLTNLLKDRKAGERYEQTLHEIHRLLTQVGITEIEKLRGQLEISLGSENPFPVPKPNIIKKRPESQNYDSFHFLEYRNVIDLRTRKLASPDKKDQNYSPVTWIRELRLKRPSSEKYIDIELHTSGRDIFPRCVTHEYEIYGYQDIISHGNFDVKIARCVRVKLDDAPVNEPFTIRIEATYWNAFQGESREWASMALPGKIDLISLMILFPSDNSYINEKYFFTEQRLPSNLTTFSDPDKELGEDFLRWDIKERDIKEPHEDCFYLVQWDWQNPSE